MDSARINPINPQGGYLLRPTYLGMLSNTICVITCWQIVCATTYSKRNVKIAKKYPH